MQKHKILEESKKCTDDLNAKVLRKILHSL
jgi:hypothetical protein